jgi:hypothetical protein
VFSRKDTLTEFEFRVRNLPYTADNFEVSIDEKTQQIVVRTVNKKYFKRCVSCNRRIDLPDIQREMPGYKLLAENLDWSFKNMTLVVSVP